MALGGLLAAILTSGAASEARPAPPVLLFYSAPVAPEEKLAAGDFEAECDLLVNARGAVGEASCKVADAAAAKWLVEPCRSAASKLRFIPSRQGATFIAAWVRWRFRLFAARP